MTKHLRVSVAAAREAGKYLRRIFLTHEQQSFRLKGKQNLVTADDRKVERIIVRRLRKHFPSYKYLGEEHGRSHTTPSSYQWVIDPIDGTSNYIARVPVFCIAIGLLFEGAPVAGLIYQPITGELYTAERSRGAYRNGKRIRVSRVRDLNRAYVSLCYGHVDAPPFTYRKQMQKYDWFKQHALKVRVIGSGSLSLAYVAAGRFESSINFPMQKPWDMAAGALLVAEAGGTVSTLQGEPWVTGASNILAANRELHQTVLKTLRR